MPDSVAFRDKLESLVRRVWPGAELLGWRRLEGGISAETTLLEVRLSDGSVNPGWS